MKKVLIAIVVIVVLGLAVWYYSQPVVDNGADVIVDESKEDASLQADLDGIDGGDVNQELQDIDADLNSL